MTPVTSHIRLNIIIAATSNFFYCAFFTAHVAVSYVTAGLAYSHFIRGPQQKRACRELCQFLISAILLPPSHKSQTTNSDSVGSRRYRPSSHQEDCCLPHGTHTTDARHQLFHHQPAASRLKSRKSFMRLVTPLDPSASSSRLRPWKDSLTDVPASVKMGLEVAKSLPAGSGEDWLCWRALNRPRTWVGRAKTVMRRWGRLSRQRSVCELRLRGATDDGPSPLLPSTRRGLQC